MFHTHRKKKKKVSSRAHLWMQEGRGNLSMVQDAVRSRARGWPLKHAKSLRVVNGFEQAVGQLLLGRVLGQEKHVEAGMRCWQPF